MKLNFQIKKCPFCIFPTNGPPIWFITFISLSCCFQFYESPDGRKTSVMEHVAKLLNQVRHDADALFRDIPSEAQTILTVLEKLENRCKELGIQVDKTWYKNPMDSASRVNMNNTSNELKPSSDSSDVNKSTPTENRDNRVSFNSTLDSGVGEPNCLSSTSNSFVSENWLVQ